MEGTAHWADPPIPRVAATSCKRETEYLSPLQKYLKILKTLKQLFLSDIRFSRSCKRETEYLSSLHSYLKISL